MLHGLHEALEQLHQLPLTKIHSTGDVPIFSFGELDAASGTQGELTQTGGYELHLKCPWRFVHNNSIVFGSGDYFDASMESNELETVANECATSLNKIILHNAADWFSGATRSDRIVHKTLVSKLGDVKIQFNSGSMLEIFSDSTQEPKLALIYSPG